MSKKTNFGEPDDILKDGDGGVVEEEAPLMEETKAAPRRKSIQESMAKATTIQSEREATEEAMGETEVTKARIGEALAYTRTQATLVSLATLRLGRMMTWFCKAKKAQGVTNQHWS